MVAVVLVDVPSLSVFQFVPSVEYSMTKSVIGRPPSFPGDHDNETVVSVLFATVNELGGPGISDGMREL